MESKALTVLTPRAFRSGETARLKITTRNLEKLTFTAYKLNPEAYFRKKHGLENVESLDIGLVAPDAEWTVDVPGYARYKPVETTYELKKLELPGVYVVKVTDEKHLQATTLVARQRSRRDRQDLTRPDPRLRPGHEDRQGPAQGAGAGLRRRAGRPRGRDRRRRRACSTTGRQAARRQSPAARTWSSTAPTSPARAWACPDKVAQGLTPARLPLHRPARLPARPAGRRPGRGPRGPERPVRQRPRRRAYRFEVTDSRGRQIVARAVTLSDFGTFHETLPLDRGAPVGTYRVRRLPARQERLRRRLRGPVVPARADRPDAST